MVIIEYNCDKKFGDIENKEYFVSNGNLYVKCDNTSEHFDSINITDTVVTFFGDHEIVRPVKVRIIVDN